MAGKKASPKKTEVVVEEPLEEVVEEKVAEEVAAPVVKSTPKKSSKSSLPDVADESLSAEEFVKAAYLSILKREADSGGLSHYSRCIGMYKTMTRQELLDDLSGSAEAATL
tara:strand:- start:9348 stop:9680 length:333 start_codon:yes stop_codon:yes gene_type:complete